MLRRSCAWSPPGRSVRPIELWNRTSPEKIALAPLGAYVTWPGLWPGVKSTSIRIPASSSVSPPPTVCSGS